MLKVYVKETLIWAQEEAVYLSLQILRVSVGLLVERVHLTEAALGYSLSLTCELVWEVSSEERVQCRLCLVQALNLLMLFSCQGNSIHSQSFQWSRKEKERMVHFPS